MTNVSAFLITRMCTFSRKNACTFLIEKRCRHSMVFNAYSIDSYWSSILYFTAGLPAYVYGIRVAAFSNTSQWDKACLLGHPKLLSGLCAHFVLILCCCGWGWLWIYCALSGVVKTFTQRVNIKDFYCRLGIVYLPLSVKYAFVFGIECCIHIRVGMARALCLNCSLPAVIVVIHAAKCLFQVETVNYRSQRSARWWMRWP